MITSKAEHNKLNSAAKKRTFRLNFKMQLKLQKITKTPTDMITFKAQHIINPAAKKEYFGENLSIKLCSQKMEILAKF